MTRGTPIDGTPLNGLAEMLLVALIAMLLQEHLHTIDMFGCVFDYELEPVPNIFSASRHSSHLMNRQVRRGFAQWRPQVLSGVAEDETK